MLVTIQITNTKMPHVKPAQFGAIVAHVMKSKHFANLKLWQTCIEISFQVGDANALAQVTGQGQLLEAEVIALLDLEPFPCPCGCGQFLAIGPCFEQSGELTQHMELNAQERELVRTHQKIAAIKSLRERTDIVKADGTRGYLGLKEAKDICDIFERTLENPLR